MGDTPDRIDPSGIPTFTGSLELLEHDITGLRGDAGKVRSTGADTHSEFQKLSAFYQAPEADQLFATTQPVKDTAGRFADDLTTVASALEGYSTEVRPIIDRLKRLKAEAAAFVEDIEDDDDWKYDGGKVDKNNDLVQDVSTAVAQFWAAERAAANKISGLVNGGTVWREDDGSGGKNMYGYSVDDMKKAGETPWGKAVEEKHHAWEIGHWAKSFVWDGFIVEGVWGTLKGLGGLVGLGGWETFKQSWKGLGQLATGLAILSIPGGMIAYDLLPEGGVKNWSRQSLKTTKEVGKSLVAWDEWRKDPGKAAGLVSFNVITTVATGGTGAVTKTGTAGKVVSAAGKVGRAVDPMTYIVKAGSAGLGKMPKIGDVTASFRGLNTVEGVDLPDGTVRLPDGQVFDPTTPEMPRLPPGKTGVELPNGVPSLDVPEGSVRLPDGDFLDLDGTLRNPDGTIKQAGEKAQHELSANDRAALDGDTPGAPTRAGEGAPVGRSPDAATAARVPELDLATVGAGTRGADDVVRLGGDDAARVGPGEVPRVGDDAARVGGDGATGPGARPGAVGDRPPTGPVAHTGDGPGGPPPGSGNGPGGRPPGSGDGPGPGGPGSGPADGPGVRPGDGPGVRPGDGPGTRPGSGSRPDVGPGGPVREVPGAPAGAGREVPGTGGGEVPGGGRDLPESGGPGRDLPEPEAAGRDLPESAGPREPDAGPGEREPAPGDREPGSGEGEPGPGERVGDEGGKRPDAGDDLGSSAKPGASEPASPPVTEVPGFDAGDGITYAERPEPYNQKTMDDYQHYRNSTTDVPAIAQNTNISESVIQRAKENLFLNRHDVAVGPDQIARGVYFTPDDQIAQLWRKAERGTLKADEEAYFRGLIAHEFVESKLLEAGLPYRPTHPDYWDPERLTVDTKNIGAHDVAPRSFSPAPISAEGSLRVWSKLGLKAPSEVIAADLSNLDVVVDAAKRGLKLE
ncbi:hypothetical protein [Streptomyces sp. NPDC057702]|uniref:hypothetical protein n=1 Tax=unclassified Streptomyces TaxID=2593676 RepID=UPI0036CB5CE9